MSQNEHEDDLLLHDEKGWAGGCWVPPKPTVSWCMLKFFDDTEVGVYGLEEIMADLYAEDRPANDETSEEIIKRLEAYKNYIPPSDRAHREYAYVLLREYRKYVKDQTNNK